MDKSYTQNNQNVRVDTGVANVLTPKCNTYYRLALFAWNPTNDAGAGILTFTIQWVQPFGGSTTATVTLNLASAPASVTIDLGIWVAAGVPIQFAAVGGSPYGAASYSYLLTITDMNHEEESGGPSPLVRLQQNNCCSRCNCNPCCCQQQSPMIVLPQQQCLPPMEYYPRRRRRRMPYAEEEDFEPPFNGPWGCEQCP